MKKKILRVITRLNVGGPAIQAVDLSIHLKEFKYETVLVYGCIENGEIEIDKIKELSENNIKTINTPTMKREINLKNDFISLLTLRRIIKQEKPDIVHSHMSKAGLLTRLAIMTLWNKPKVVHTFHGNVLDGYFGTIRSYLIRFTERRLAKRTDKLISISSKQKDDICNKFKITSPDNVEVVPLGFDLSIIGKRPGFFDCFVDVGIIGRLAEVKNHKLFITFFKYLKYALYDRKKSCVGLVIGDGEANCMLELQKAAKDYPILFCGYLDHTRVMNLYNTLDLVVCTSYNEGTPVSLIEAMAAKVLVASTRVGGVEDLLGSGNCERRGFYIDPDNLYTSVERIADCLEDDTKYKEITDRAYQYVHNNHTLEKLLKHLDLVYKGLFE